MGWNQFDVSGIAIFWVLLVFIITFSALRILRISIPKIPMSKSYLPKVMRVLPLFESIVWFLIVIWGIQFMFEGSLYFALLLVLFILAAVVWIWWFALRDFVAGIILKMQDLYEDNQRIKTAETEGKIRSLGHLSIEIESLDGEIVKVPYGRITGNLLWKNKPQERQNHYQFQVKVSKSGDIGYWKSKIQAGILNLPWTSPNREPEVQLLEETAKHFVFRVRVYSPGTEFFHLIERETHNLLAQNN